MQLLCNGTVRNNEFHLSLKSDKVNSFYYILIAASIYLHNNNPLYMYDDELDLCADLIEKVLDYRDEINRKN